MENTLIIKPPKGISLENAKAALLNLNFEIINHSDMYYDFSDDLSEEDLHLIEISKQQAEMKIKWSTQAELSYLENLNYWDNHNKSHSYSDKIDDALYKLEEEISISPYFLAQYIEHLDLYKRNFLNGKFAIYYQVLEEENLIRIIYFRSNKQKPL